MLMATGDHGCRLLVTPDDFAVLVVLVVPTKHAQDCGACSQGSQAELYVCYHVRLKIKIHCRFSHEQADEVGCGTLFCHCISVADEWNIVLRLIVPAHWMISKPHNLDRISVAGVRFDRWNGGHSTLQKHQHGGGVGTHVSFAGFRFL